MQKQTLFISDLHLSEAHEGLNDLWNQFIKKTLNDKSVEAVYILGDFFERWMGDDLMGAWEKSIADDLTLLNKQGIAVFFLHGNRDFLVGDMFINAAHATFLPDPSVINLYGARILIKHGDDLCLNDVAYQRYRYWVRKSWIKKLYLSLPKMLRHKIAASIRQKSALKNKVREKQLEKTANYDVISPTQIQKCLLDTQADYLVHGHIHQAKHLKNYVVLGDWWPKMSVLHGYADGQLVLDSFE